MKIFTFEQLKKFVTDIANEHDLQDIYFVNDRNLRGVAGTNYHTIQINYDLAVKQLLNKYPNDIATINFSLLQLICHEIVHREHEVIYHGMRSEKKEISKNAQLTSLHNEMQSVDFAQNYPKIYYKKHDIFIDEYIADLLGSFYAIDYINREIKTEFSGFELCKLSRDIATFIARNYYEITILNNFKKITPMDRFVKLADSKKIKLDRKLFANIRVSIGMPTESDLNDFEINIINPNHNATNHSEFEKLLYGEDTQLLSIVQDIINGRIRTDNIFLYLKTYSENLAKENDRGNNTAPRSR